MRPPKAKRQRRIYESQDEGRLENLVFGTANDDDDEDDDDDDDDGVDNLFKDDDKVKNNDDKSDSDDDSDSEEENSMGGESNHQDLDSDDTEELNPKHDDEDDEDEEEEGGSWMDQDDDEQYGIEDSPKSPDEQRNELDTILETPENTQLDVSSMEINKSWIPFRNKMEIDDFQNYVAYMESANLKSDKIDIKLMNQINCQTECEGPIITSLQFHPSIPIAFVAGHSGVVSIFQVHDKASMKLSSTRFDNFKISTAKFLKNGNEIILGCRNRKYVRIYDLTTENTPKCQLPHSLTKLQCLQVSPDGKYIAIAGKSGEIYILDGRSKEHINTTRILKRNKNCDALAFSPDGNTLFGHGDGGKIYSWDLRKFGCTNVASDNGCLRGSTIAISPNGEYLAAGSNQGIVNIYDINSVMNKKQPEPLKVINNIAKTSITNLKFNSTSEILALSSCEKDNAFKLIHIPSFTAYSNFPTSQNVLSSPHAIDFSPGSSYLGTTNHKNKAYLFKLKHFNENNY